MPLRAFKDGRLEADNEEDAIDLAVSMPLRAFKDGRRVDFGPHYGEGIIEFPCP